MSSSENIGRLLSLGSDLAVLVEEAANERLARQVEMVMETQRRDHLDHTTYHMLCRADKQGCIVHHRNIQECNQG